VTWLLQVLFVTFFSYTATLPLEALSCIAAIITKIAHIVAALEVGPFSFFITIYCPHPRRLNHHSHLI